MRRGREGGRELDGGDGTGKNDGQVCVWVCVREGKG